MTATAGGAFSVTALETATIRASGDSIAKAKGGSPFDENDSKGMAFQIATNVILSGATATVTDSAIVANGGNVDGQRRQHLDARGADDDDRRVA